MSRTSFWRSPPGAIVITLCVGLLVAFGAVAVQVYGMTRPDRHIPEPFDFDSLLMKVESIQVNAVDGLLLDGWLIRGAPDKPAIVLCHDLGSDRTELTPLAVALRSRGFTVLLFDFRGHGGSEGNGSTLGLEEARDILGAVDFLEQVEGLPTEKIGIYGVGMGAYAALLAAADRPSLRVLVLDGLYPDISYSLARNVYAGWSFGVEYLNLLPLAVFAALNPAQLKAASPARDVLREMTGRDTLLLASESDLDLRDEIKRMYDGIPEQIDVDGNLVILPATQNDGLYGDDLVEYQERIGSFFGSRLTPPRPSPKPVS